MDVIFATVWVVQGAIILGSKACWLRKDVCVCVCVFETFLLITVNQAAYCVLIYRQLTAGNDSECWCR